MWPPVSPVKAAAHIDPPPGGDKPRPYTLYTPPFL